MTEDKFVKTVEGGTYRDTLTIDDYLGEQEISVKITLHEYRELVSLSATTQQLIKKAEDEAREDRLKAQKLTEEIARLKSEVYELRKQLDGTDGNCTIDNLPIS